MEVVILQDDISCSKYVADLIKMKLSKKSDLVLGLPTGRTPLLLYRNLIQMYKRQEISFKDVQSFNLDEYVGVAKDHPASYAFLMHNNFFMHIDANDKNLHIPNGLCSNVEEECMQYEEKIKAVGGIDLQILGIGANGHIAFNEPGSSLSSKTRVKTLTRKTIIDNAFAFGGIDNVPLHVITMGIGTIMSAKQVVLLAFGENKAEIIAKMIEGPITASVPASILQLHENAIVVIDEAASRKLERLEYYHHAFDNKPLWQKI